VVFYGAHLSSGQEASEFKVSVVLDINLEVSSDWDMAGDEVSKDDTIEMDCNDDEG